MDVGLNLRDLRATGRLAAFSSELKLNECEALGVLAMFYEATQDRELVTATADKFAQVCRVILRGRDVFRIVDALVAADLADDNSDGSYTIRGNAAHVAKLRAFRERAAKGGNIRAKKQLEAASKQPASSLKQPPACLPAASSSPGDWLLDPGSNTADPPPAGAGVPPQGGTLAPENFSEAASREFDSRADVVTPEQALAMTQPGMDTETNARPTRQLEAFALQLFADICDAATPPVTRPARWDRQHHRDIAKLVGRYPEPEHWQVILTHYITDAHWSFLGSRTTAWLAKNVDDVAGRAMGLPAPSVDPFAEGRRYAEECERKEREERERKQRGPEPQSEQ